MSISEELRFSCIRCGNCCTDKDTLVNLTYLDILKIKNGLSLNFEEVLNLVGFYIYEKPITDDERKRMVIAPIETENGLAFVALRKNSLGGCYFYSSAYKKCLIYNLRPMFCRTFPFTFKLLDQKNHHLKKNIKVFYTEKGKEYCPGIEADAPKIDEKYWITLGKKIIEDMNKNSIVIENWNNAVKTGKINRSVRNFLLNIFKL